MNIENGAAPTGRSGRQGFNRGRVQGYCIPRNRLYLAAPLSARDDPEHYPACRSLVASTWPEAEVVEGVRAFVGARDWQARYAQTIRSCDWLVFVPRADGTIGAGVLREIVEAVFWHVRVMLATPDRLIPVEEVAFRLLAHASPDYFAEVIVGDQ